jgi:hypothetical protein
MPTTFEVNVFKDLVDKYTSWEELQKYLESNEGGLFRIVDKSDDGFCLIRYEKGSSKMDLPHSKWFRSIVWNTKTNRPVCVAPPKASSEEFNFKTIKELNDAGVVCQELLEGFMINCFRTVGDEKLHITSRSKLNAAGKFYSEKSFRELFQEAYMNTKECPFYSETIIQDNSKEIRNPDSSKGEIATFYSFLVQHKEHRIVKRNDNNIVVAVHCGVVYDDGRVVIEDSPEMFDNKASLQNIKMDVKAAKGSYAQITSRVPDSDESTTEVQKWIKNYLLENDWQFQGLVFKDSQGNRWRFRSEKYSMVKSLRGNSSNVRERFCQLYVQNLVQKYLEYFPDDIIIMTVHLMFMNTIVKMLYDSYVDLHITKVKTPEQIDKMFLPHLYSLHGVYLSQLRSEGKKINLSEITMYLHKQPWQRISFLIKNLVDRTNTQ